ncbi:hypothetical protein ABZ354_16555 [Streptomyces sp. NPDC005925]|uniref:hypothetical protein n=1 Tax=Streptomyces sp. NPDC005925 TaxID=3157172 RepID=UPI0033C57B54
MILCFVLAAVVLALGGFLAGRASTTGGEDCAELRKLTSHKQREADALNGPDGDRTEWLISLRTHAYLIKQNPGCFTAEDRAKAQATLDRFEYWE